MTDFPSANKRIAKNTLLLYLRSILIILVSLYTSRIVLDILGISDYGIYNLVSGLVTMFSLLSGSMVSATQRFITYALGENKSDSIVKVFHTSVSLHFVIGGLVVILMECIGVWLLCNKLNIPIGRVDAAFWVMQCSIVMFFINIISIPYNALIVAHERMSAFAYISILDVCFKLVSVLFLVLVNKDKLILYAIFLMLFSGAIQLIYSLYCRRYFEEAKHIRFCIDRRLFGRMFSFAGWNMFGSGSALLRNQGVDILLNLYFGVTINAAKGICNQVQNAVYQFVTNFQMAVNPQLTKSIAEGNLKRNHELVIQGSRFSFYLMMLLGVPLIVSTSQVLNLWLVEVPVYATEFIQWTCIYLLWDCLSRFLMNSVFAYGRIRNYQIVVGGTKLLALPIVWFILNLGGSPLSGILVNIVLEIVCLCLRLFFNRKYNKLPIMKYIRKVVVPCWFIFFVAIFLSYLFSAYVSDVLLITVPISFCFVCLVIWFIGINKEEQQFILSKTTSLILRH